MEKLKLSMVVVFFVVASFAIASGLLIPESTKVSMTVQNSEIQ